jgi:N-acetylglucosaminyldiphosphoundecaprenol N-acetyl-beta-D-mannosaminyltransferase
LTASVVEDDFSRRVYCVLGVPVDEIDMAGLVARVHQAAARREPFFISTPNLNYLMLSQRDWAFRRSLLESDICPADGVGVLLICRLSSD